jgi:hypothetical protein
MKNMLKTFLFCCLFFCVNSFSETPDNTSEKSEKIALRSLDNGLAHGVGVGGSLDSTWGFGYRRYFPANIGVSANVGGSFIKQQTNVGFGAGVLFSLVNHHFPSFGLQESSVRVYMTVNATGQYGRDNRPETDAVDRNSFVFGVGVGPGVEYFLNKNFAFNVELPWTTKFRVRNGDIAFEGSAPTLGAGFTYYI